MRQSHSHQSQHKLSSLRTEDINFRIRKPNHLPSQSTSVPWTWPNPLQHTGGARTQTHTTQQPSREGRGAAKTRAQQHAPTPDTPARNAGVQAERTHKDGHPNTRARNGGARSKPKPKHAHQHHRPHRGVAGYRLSMHTNTHTPTPQPGLAGCTPEPDPTQTHHKTLARIGGIQAERANKHTHPNIRARIGGLRPTPQTTHKHHEPRPGLAGHKQSRHTNSNNPHPSQEWRGAAETRTQAQTPTPNTPARIHGVQAESAHKHTHPSTPATSGGPKRILNPEPNTLATNGGLHPCPNTRTTRPSQEKRGAGGARA